MKRNHKIYPSYSLIQQFYELLPVGKENAMSAKSICLKLGLQKSRRVSEDHKRQLRLVAERAIQSGLLFFADNGGYFIPVNPGDGSENIHRFESQIRRMSKRLKKLKELSYKRFGHQDSFDI
jgi:hypothetical protein